LWAEPKGDGGNDSGSISSGTESIRKGKSGESYHAKVRRFVIIAVHDGHCICLPIMTYGGQGVKKRGVHAEHHAIIYTEKAVAARGEKDRGLMKKPIKVIPSSPRHKLDNFSRLNYAKTYTVEYNVKVWFIGKVEKGSEWQLKTDYNRIHPPLDTRGLPPSFSEDISEEPVDYPLPLNFATLGYSGSWQALKSTLFPTPSGSAGTYPLKNSMESSATPSTDTTSSQLIGADLFDQITVNNQLLPVQETDAPEDSQKHEKQDQDNEHGLQNPKAPKGPHQPKDQDQDDANKLQNPKAPEDPHQPEDLDEEYQSIKNYDKEDLLYDNLDIYDAEA
jgi:hypothetical protein